MKPIDFPQANNLLCAAPGTEDLVEDLPVCRYTYGWNPNDGGTPCTASCWKATWWERLKILWTGRVYFACLAKTHPPVFLTPTLPDGIPPRLGELPRNPRRECPTPPGWRCTRKPGHSGPCAAIPLVLESEGEEDRDGD